MPQLMSQSEALPISRPMARHNNEWLASDGRLEPVELRQIIDLGQDDQDSPALQLIDQVRNRVATQVPGDQFPGFGQFGHDAATDGGGLGRGEVEGDRGLGAWELNAWEVDDVRPDQGQEDCHNARRCSHSGPGKRAPRSSIS